MTRSFSADLKCAAVSFTDSRWEEEEQCRGKREKSSYFGCKRCPKAVRYLCLDLGGEVPAGT